MKIVCYEVSDDLDIDLVCTVTFDGKAVTFDGQKRIVDQLRKGIQTGPDTDVLPSAGAKYMDVLSREFVNGSRFYTKVVEDDQSPFDGAAERLAADLIAVKDKANYRYDPGHRRKPGPGWNPTEAGWTKPRPTQLQQSKPPVEAPIGVQPFSSSQVITASKYQYRYDPGHDHPPVGPGWERTSKGWRRGLQLDAPAAPSPVSQPAKARPAAPSIEGNPIWKKRRKEIDEILRRGKRVDLARDTSGGHVNPVWFEKFVDGSKGVIKPASQCRSPSEIRYPMDGYDWNDKVGQSRREVHISELDDMLGLGVVPPTVWATKNVEGKKEESSVQYFVTGCKKIHEASFSAVQTASRDLHKIAALDVVAGSVDRHANNCLVGGGHAYAIDNGLSMPDKTDQIRSCAITWLIDNDRERAWVYTDTAIAGIADKLDGDIIDRLAAVPEGQFKDFFKSRNLQKAGEEAWKRTQKLVKFAKRDPEYVKAYQGLKKDDDPDTEEWKIRKYMDEVVGCDSDDLKRNLDDVKYRFRVNYEGRPKSEWIRRAMADLTYIGNPKVAWQWGAHLWTYSGPDAKKAAMVFFKKAKKILLKNHEVLDLPSPRVPPVVKSVPPPPKSPVLPEAPRRVKNWQKVKTPSKFEVVSRRLARIGRRSR